MKTSVAPLERPALNLNRRYPAMLLRLKAGRFNHQRAPWKPGQTTHKTTEPKDRIDPIQITLAGLAQSVDQVQRADFRSFTRGLNPFGRIRDRADMCDCTVPFTDLPGKIDNRAILTKRQELTPWRPIGGQREAQFAQPLFDL